MRYRYIYDYVKSFSIYLQIKSGFTILVDLHTNYLTILFKVLFSSKICFSLCYSVGEQNRIRFYFDFMQAICDQCNRKR